jgi:hypothetical protein
VEVIAVVKNQRSEVRHALGRASAPRHRSMGAPRSRYIASTFATPLRILEQQLLLVRVVRRLGIRGFNPKLKRAAGRLDSLRTPEGEPIRPNTLAELRRDMERRRLISNQIRQIEEARLNHFEQAPNDGPHAWCACWRV